MAGLSIPHLRKVCSVASVNATTLVRIPIRNDPSTLTVESGQTLSGWLYRDAGERGLQVQHNLQRHRSNSSKPNDPNSDAAGYAREP